MLNPPSSSENLSDSVVQYLIGHIRGKQLKSGDLLPSELRVSTELGVSRGIVREAFRGLKVAGILDSSNGRAPRVASISPDGIAQLFEHAISTDQATMFHILDLRAAVEVRAAELAATSRSPQQVAALLSDVATMQSSLDNHSRFVATDTHFHETIGAASGNPLFGLLSSALRTSLIASIGRVFQNWKARSDQDQIVSTHRQIAEAICDRDPVKARDFMIVHFEEAFLSFQVSRETPNGALLNRKSSSKKQRKIAPQH